MVPRKLTYAIYIPMTWLKIPRNTTIVPREYVFAFYVTPPVRSPGHGRSARRRDLRKSTRNEELDVHWKNHEKKHEKPMKNP